jgi:predicted phage terminase large subunit-like protein
VTRFRKQYSPAPLIDLPQLRDVKTAEASIWEQTRRVLMLAGGHDDPPIEVVEPHVKPDISLSAYTRAVWHVLYPTRPLSWNWHIDAINEHLEAVTAGEILKLVINISPRCGKSTHVCVIWPTWEWHFMPWVSQLFFSYSQRFSKRDSLRCRKIIGHPWYQERWGGIFQLSYDQNEKLQFTNTRGGMRMASSLGGSGTGEGADRVIVDDPIKASDAHSDTIREGVNTWWDEEGYSRVNDPSKSARVMIMQRTHTSDLSGHVLAKDSGWESLVLPMRYERKVQVNGMELTNGDSRRSTSLGHYDPRTKPGELMWPARFPEDILQEWEKELKPYGVASQLQQRPAPSGGGIFKTMWWNWWKPLHSELGPVFIKLDNGEVIVKEARELPRKLDEQIQSWDLTFDSKSSRVSGHVYGRKDKDVFVLGELVGEWDFVQQCAKIEELTHAFPNAHLKLVENAANAKAMVSTLRSIVPGIVLVRPEGDKATRARSQTAYVESGNWYLPHPALAPWVWDWLQEFALFDKGPYNDRVDDWSQASRRIYGGLALELEPARWATV